MARAAFETSVAEGIQKQRQINELLSAGEIIKVVSHPVFVPNRTLTFNNGLVVDERYDPSNFSISPPGYIATVPVGVTGDTVFFSPEQTKILQGKMQDFSVKMEAFAGLETTLKDAERVRNIVQENERRLERPRGLLARIFG